MSSLFYLLFCNDMVIDRATFRKKRDQRKWIYVKSFWNLDDDMWSICRNRFLTLPCWVYVSVSWGEILWARWWTFWIFSIGRGGNELGSVDHCKWALYEPKSFINRSKISSWKSKVYSTELSGQVQVCGSLMYTKLGLMMFNQVNRSGGKLSLYPSPSPYY